MSEDDWTIEKALATYNTEYWSDGYFGVNASGAVEVRIHREGKVLHGALPELVETLVASGLRLPVLVRFMDILHNRVLALIGSFCRASQGLGYRGRYTSVYPIKVNQQRRVVEEVVAVHAPESQRYIGLEAGSKPELLAVMALLPERESLIVCNGYKDREYIRLALIGQKMGLKTLIVIEKLSELALIAEASRDLGVTPQLGVRVRLNSIGKGNWQNTGGEKAKFGLQAAQLVLLIERLRALGGLNWLQMLHFHMGSQISDVHDIQCCIAEAVRYFIELRHLGAQINTIDVGGGLSVDYEGTRTHTYFSMNYSLDEYAFHILQPIKEACDQHGFDHPDVITEAGRALTAHHALLITDVVASESTGHTLPQAPDEQAQPVSCALFETYRRTCEPMTERETVEQYHHLEQLLQEAQERFKQGALALKAWADAESCFYAACKNIQQQLTYGIRAHHVIRDELNTRLADKFFVNFSLFQSIPDAWGIGQVFPIMPLERLHQRPTARAVIHDMTCDSDGRINHYVDGMGLEQTLPMPEFVEGRPYYVGIFMVGAYQEILGDMHNLFGDTDAVDVTLEEQNGFILSDQLQGDTVDTVLAYVNFDANTLYKRLQARLCSANMGLEAQKACIAEISEGLRGYTYLE